MKLKSLLGLTRRETGSVPPPPPAPMVSADRATMTAEFMVGLVLLIEVLYVLASYRSWRRAFSTRKPRKHALSPSFRKRPNVMVDYRTNAVPMLTKYRSSIRNLVASAPRSPRVSTLKTQASFSPYEARRACFEAINAQRSSDVDDESDESRHAHAMAALQKKSASNVLVATPQDGDDAAEVPPQAPPPVPVDACTADEGTAPALEMDHVHISFGQYLWGAHFVAIPSILLLLMGSARLLFALALRRVGLLRAPTASQLESMACDLILESSLAIQMQALRHDEHGDEIGTFVWSPFPMMVDADDGEVHPAGRGDALFSVDLNLTKRAIHKATLNESQLPLADLVALLCHAIAADQHPKVHAYANWGIDPSDRICHPYLRRMSVVTTLYNHFGLSNAPWIMRLVLRSKGAGRELLSVFEDSLTRPPPSHAEVRQLVRHSRLVRFIVELRGPFMRVFAEQRSNFPESYSAEAYFLGTVVHSLDHFNYIRHVDPWALVAMRVSPALETLRRIQCVVRYMISDDLPGIVFARDFKDAPMAFHRQVYQAGRRIDPQLAAQMQTCIVK